MDEETLVETYRELVEPLYRYVSRWCGGDRALAEDTTQEVWLRAVAAWREDGLPERPIAWLRTAARNLLINYHRRKQPLSLNGVSPPKWQAVTPGLEVEFDSAEQAALVHRGLSRLRSREAHLLEAFHFDGMSMADIAEEHGLSERAVEGRLRRARAKLRRYLESAGRREGEPS